mgnify:CR=1 FL=1
MLSNPVIENILARRSTRSFTNEPVGREQLEAIVTCGQWAPSGMNRQELAFAVLSAGDEVARLAAVLEPLLGRGAYDMYAAQAAVLVAVPRDYPYARQDDSCALENMFLAATSLGLGSCWINQLEGLCDHPAVRALLDGYGIPADYEVHGVCALGHIARETPAKERKSRVIWV